MSSRASARQAVQPRSSGQQSKVVCILGMHRSGTSLVARLLNLRGLELGPAEGLLPAAQDNPSGFWEHKSFHEINDEILSRLGGRWDKPPQFAPGWEKASTLGPLYQRAREIIEKHFSRLSCWGWKDPRNSLTIPFWRELLPDLTFVICVRHPLDVYKSLRRRDWFSRSRGTRLWTLYTLAALRHTQNSPRIITHYESYFTGWEAELSRVAGFLQLPNQAAQPTPQQIQSFIDPHLWHHRSSLEELQEARGVDPLCKVLYQELQPTTPASGRSASATEERLSTMIETQARILATNQVGAWRWLDRCREARLFLGKKIRPVYARIRSIFSL